MPSKPAATAKKRRWHQFSLRALLILTLLCALGSLAWVRYIEPLRNEYKVMARLTQSGATVFPESVDVGWIGRWLDQRQFVRIRGIDARNAPLTDADLRSIRNLPGLIHLKLNGTKISDAGLQHLTGLPKLAYLELDGTGVTDVGIRCLGQFRSLVHVSLNETNITDQGLVHLVQLPQIGPPRTPFCSNYRRGHDLSPGIEGSY